MSYSRCGPKTYAASSGVSHTSSAGTSTAHTKPQMRLSIVRPVESRTIKIANVTVKAQFGDLFERTSDMLPTDMMVPAVVGILGGATHSIWVSLNGYEGETLYTDGVASRIESNIPQYPYAVVFSYPPEITEWDIVFRSIGNVLDPVNINNTILVLPTIGTNNGIDYHDSALGMMYYLCQCMEDADSNLSKVKEIRIVTPYSASQDNTSCRTLRHIFNMIDIRTKNANTDNTCCICYCNNAEVVLECGHYILCKMCNYKFIKAMNSVCPICKKVYNHTYDCMAPTMASHYRCCGNVSPIKTDITYIPCGHTSVLCKRCESDSVTVCPICETPIENKMKVYT